MKKMRVDMLNSKLFGSVSDLAPKLLYVARDLIPVLFDGCEFV